MAWAVIKSENVATVWLLYHLCDKLNMSQFRQIADKVGLTQRKDETYQQYKLRIRDKSGVVVNKRALMEAVFEEAKKELITDLIFGGEEGEIEKLTSSNFEDFSSGKINNILSSDTIDRLAASIQKRYSEMKELKPYDFRVLSRIRDFKVLVGLKYVVRLRRRWESPPN